LATIRAALEASSPGLAAQELDGLFLGTEEAPSTRGMQYAQAFVGSVEATREESTPHVLAIDIGETIDFTWITVLSRTGMVLGMYRFNTSSPGVPRATFFEYLVAEVAKAARSWRVQVIVCDTAKAGAPVAQSLRTATGLHVEGFGTDAPGKKAALLEALSVALASVSVTVPNVWRSKDLPHGRTVDHVDQLRKEFSELEPRDTPAGKRYWDHPRGGHDDGVVSLALAWHGLEKFPPQRVSKTPASAVSPERKIRRHY